MKRLIVLLLACCTVFVAGAVPVASPDSSVNAPTISQLKAKIKAQSNRISDLNDQIDAQDATISDQSDTITRLRARDPLDAVVARNPDGLWNAMLAIWHAFPTRPPGQLCGYDKSSSTAGLGLTLSSFQFDEWQGC